MATHPPILRRQLQAATGLHHAQSSYSAPRGLWKLPLSPFITRTKRFAFFFEYRIDRLLISIAVVAQVVKVLRAGSRELWLDEFYSVFVASKPFSSAMEYVLHDVHPPLFYVLLWCWVHVFGTTETVLRLFSISVSMIAAAAMYWSANKWMNRRHAALALVLFALSPMLFPYSLELRMYMLEVCLIIFLLGLHHGILKAAINKRLIAGYALLAAAVYYTHYIGLFALAAFWFDALIRTRHDRERRRLVTIALLACLLLISPWVPVMFHQRAAKLEQSRLLQIGSVDRTALTFVQGTQPGAVAGKQYGSPVKSVGAAIGLFPARSLPLFVLLAMPPVAMLLLIAILGVRGNAPCGLFLLLASAILTGAVLLGSPKTRFFLAMLPPFFLAVTSAYEQLRRGPFRRPIVVVSGLTLLIYTAGFARQASRHDSRPWTNLITTLEKRWRSGDVVVFDALYAQVPFDYYAGQFGLRFPEEGFPVSVYRWWDSQFFKGWGGPVIHLSDLQRTTADLAPIAASSNVWLVLFEENYYDPNDSLLHKLIDSGLHAQAAFPPQGSGPEAPETESVPRLIQLSAAPR